MLCVLSDAVLCGASTADVATEFSKPYQHDISTIQSGVPHGVQIPWWVCCHQPANISVLSLLLLLLPSHICTAMDTHGNYEPNLCATAAPGCSFQQSSNNCVMSSDLTSQLAQLRPQDVGTCSAACYLRVLDSCRKTASTSDPDSCWANKGCTWANGACGPDLFSSQLDTWGRKVAAAAEACSREKEAWGCGQAGAKGLLPLPSASAQEALQRGVPGPGQQDAQCPV